jgi:hypothetical protein
MRRRPLGHGFGRSQVRRRSPTAAPTRSHRSTLSLVSREPLVGSVILRGRCTLTQGWRKILRNGPTLRVVRLVEVRNFEIRIKGQVSEAVLASFEGLHGSVQPVETVLSGPVQDQAALHGLLDRIQALGLELVEVRQLPDQ